MATFSTAAWAAHDIGLATALGGTIFGKLALTPALQDISNAHERGLVMKKAWSRFNLFSGVGMGSAALIWMVGRAAINGRSAGPDVRRLVYAKDALLAGAVITTAMSSFAGQRIVGANHGDVPSVDANAHMAGGQPARAEALRKASSRYGTLSLLMTAGVLAVTSALAMKAGESGKWTLISRLLP